MYNLIFEYFKTLTTEEKINFLGGFKMQMRALMNEA